MQIEVTTIAKDVIQKSFEVSPDSVYGLLIGLLVVMLIVVFYLREQDKQTIIKLKLATLESLKDMNNSLVLLQQSQSNDSQRILVELQESQIRISKRFDEIAKIT